MLTILIHLSNYGVHTVGITISLYTSNLKFGLENHARIIQDADVFVVSQLGRLLSFSTNA